MSISFSQIAAASSLAPLRHPHVAEVQVGRDGAGVEIDGAPVAALGLGEVLPPHRLEADLVLEEREDRLVLRALVDVGELREAAARVVGLGPLVLLLVQLLQVHQRVLVLRIEPQHLVEGLERAVHEAAALVVETEAEEDVRVLELAQPRALQQRSDAR